MVRQPQEAAVVRASLALFVCLSVSAATRIAEVQSPPSDAEIVKGIRHVDEGEYELAILTLDVATRRLAAQGTRSDELGRAYLYLGIAYLARGHETMARAKFQEALALVKDLQLDPEKFSPKVLEAIQQAKQASGQAAAASPKKKGSKTGLILLGVGGAAAAGVGVAASGGSAATPTTLPATLILRAAGTVVRGMSRLPHAITIPRSGTLEVTVMWAESAALVTAELYQPPALLQRSTPTTYTSPQRISTTIQTGDYRVDVFLRTNAADPPVTPATTSSANYTIEVTLR
jgi:tetratricopeptide (TPR) repeat protein